MNLYKDQSMQCIKHKMKCLHVNNLLKGNMQIFFTDFYGYK